MWRNCLLRSGLEEPSWVLRFPCKLYFCARSSFPTVVEPTMCPFSQSSLARVRVLLHVQRIPRIGSPRTVGSIRASRSERSVGSFFVTHFRPPPGFRTRPPARGCSSKCCLPRVIRGREIPVARCTMVTPPWPMDRASAAHHSRSVRSSRCGAMSAYRFSSAAIGEPMVGSVTFIHVQVLRSLTRRGFIALLTYAGAYLFIRINAFPSPELQALIPAGAYILSTLTLPPLKKWWMDR